MFCQSSMANKGRARPRFDHSVIEKYLPQALCHASPVFVEPDNQLGRGELPGVILRAATAISQVRTWIVFLLWVPASHYKQWWRIELRFCRRSRGIAAYYPVATGHRLRKAAIGVAV